MQAIVASAPKPDSRRWAWNDDILKDTAETKGRCLLDDLPPRASACHSPAPARSGQGNSGGQPPVCHRISGRDLGSDGLRLLV